MNIYLSFIYNYDTLMHEYKYMLSVGQEALRNISEYLPDTVELNIPVIPSRQGKVIHHF